MTWLYTRPGCDLCAVARALLEVTATAYQEVVVGDPLLEQRLQQLCGAVIVPVLYDAQAQQLFGLANVGHGARWVRLLRKDS